MNEDSKMKLPNKYINSFPVEMQELDARVESELNELKKTDKALTDQVGALTLKVNRALSLAIAALGTLTFFITIGCLIFLFYLMRG